MTEAVKTLLASKKVLLALLSIVVWIAGKVGLDLSADELFPIVGPLWGALLGQTVADVGKSAALVAAGARVATAGVTASRPMVVVGTVDTASPPEIPSGGRSDS